MDRFWRRLLDSNQVSLWTIAWAALPRRGALSSWSFHYKWKWGTIPHSRLSDFVAAEMTTLLRLSDP